MNKQTSAFNMFIRLTVKKRDAYVCSFDATITLIIDPDIDYMMAQRDQDIMCVQTVNNSIAARDH